MRKKGQGSIISILQPMVVEIAVAIQKNSAFYLEHFPNARPITSLILCGGGALLSGLPNLLHKELPNLKISRGNPMLNMHNAKDMPLNLSYTTAIGLGLTNVFGT